MTDQVKTNGIIINYEESGAGEPLILLMGLGAPGSKWKPHMECYEEYFHVYALDNRGAGLSSKPETDSYTIQEMAEDTIGFMDALGIESAHLNGISMGGAIVLYMAVHYPKRVRSIILTNTFPRCTVSFRRIIEILRDTNGQLDPAIGARLTQWIIYSQTFQETNENYLEQVAREDAAYSYPMPSYAYKAQCNAILSFDITEDLGKIQAPALVAGGDRDLFIPVSLTKEMADRIPNARLYIAQDGGHVQHWEQLEEYNRISLDFLRQVSTGQETSL